MNRRLGICLLGLVVLTVAWSAVAAGATVTGPAATEHDGRASATQPLTTPEDFDNTLFRIHVYENQSARWTIQHSRSLRNETEVEQFEDFAAEFRTNETSTYTNFRNRASSLVAFGTDVTGRQMSAEGFTRDASVAQLGQTQGVLELSFRWTNFSEADGERIAAGDVFEGGMFVGQGQRLEFRRGPGLAFADVQPEPDSLAEQGDLAASDSVTWIGEVQFADERPTVELAPRDAVSGANGVDGEDPTDDPGNTENDTGEMVPMLFAGALVLLTVVGGAAWYGGYLPPGRDGSTATEQPATDSPDAGGTADTGPQVASGGGGAAATQVTEEELLSDEDRVLSLLEDNGGRMKQVAIVEETEWSKSKVSMLLSDMEDEGDISKLRLGRENIISLAGQEPDAAGSPFEDE